MYRKETLQITRFASLSSHHPRNSASGSRSCQESELRLELLRIQNEAKEIVFCRQYNRVFFFSGGGRKVENIK